MNNPHLKKRENTMNTISGIYWDCALSGLEFYGIPFVGRLPYATDEGLSAHSLIAC
jgi:hypothetical protein